MSMTEWTVIKVVCVKCGHYLTGCYCDHFGKDCMHLNVGEYGSNGLAECFNCKKWINKDREAVKDFDD